MERPEILSRLSSIPPRFWSVGKMTSLQWAKRFSKIWIGSYFLLVIVFLLAFMTPWSPRENYIDESSFESIMFSLSIVYFPYISVSVAGFFSFTGHPNAIPAHAQAFVQSINWIVIGFNSLIFIFSLVFIVSPTMNVEVYNMLLTKFISLLSILLAGLMTFFYSRFE